MCEIKDGTTGCMLCVCVSLDMDVTIFDESMDVISSRGLGVWKRISGSYACWTLKLSAKRSLNLDENFDWGGNVEGDFFNGDFLGNFENVNETMLNQAEF